MAVTCKVVKIGFADIEEAEKRINDILRKETNFIDYRIVNNGCHSSIIIFSGDTNKSITPQVKIVEYSLDSIRSEEIINDAMKDIMPIRIDIVTPLDGNRLVILYDAND